MNQTQNIKYLDCITGKVGAPFDKKGKVIFQIMMVFFMVTLMVTINWNLNTDDRSPLNFALTFYEYPAMFCIAVAVRLLVADLVIDRFIRKVIIPKLDGLAKSIAITLANVVFMGTIMAVFGIIVAGGGLESLSIQRYLGMLPSAYVMAFAVNFFLVSPLVKVLYHGVVQPALKPFSLTPQTAIEDKL